MEIGKLRHRLDLQTFTETRDSHGGVTRDFSTFATVWGSVDPLSGKELLDGMQMESQVTHRVRIRQRTDIKPKDRLLHRTRLFEILSILDIREKTEEQILMCTEVIP